MAERKEVRMEWYWWALIAVGLGLIGSLKLKVFSNVMKKRKDKSAEAEEE